MKLVVMLVLGLFIGAFGAVTALSALRQATPLSRGVMSLTTHHFGTLRESVEHRRCDAVETQRRLSRLRGTADDFESALIPSGGDDAALARHIDTYRDALDAALSRAATDCDALMPSLAEIGAACKSCHREFKS